VSAQVSTSRSETTTPDIADAPDGVNGVDGPETAARFVAWLRTGGDPGNLFAPDVFGDVTLPHWRLQADNAADLVAIRATGHPWPGRVRVERLEPTPRGWVMQLEERWIDEHGRSWYCREMFRADVTNGAITDFAVYCTGDWDEAAVLRHEGEVRLLRP
jgi:hypothetical protein